MRPTIFFLFGGALLTATVLVGGCASSNHAGHGRHSFTSGMMCPKCETVWLGQGSAAQGTKIQAMSFKPEMVCPDCDAMAQSYFQDGEKVLHECPTCKVTPRPVRPC